MRLSPRARAVIAGLAQGSEEVNVDGIFAPDEVWEEVRKAFPPVSFQTAVAAGSITYDEEAGT